MNILISGATGYIGTTLVKLLIEDGVKIGAINRAVSAHFQSFENDVDIYTADISNELTVDLKKQYSLFIHLAAANDVDSANTHTALNVTALGTRNSLEFCKRNNINKFIYFSTFQVYGKVENEMTENTVLQPVNHYAITHKFAEDYVKMYAATSEINYIILRPTNIYGSPLYKKIDRWSLVPNCFCKEAFEKQKITLFSSGKQVRNFISLSDTIGVTKELSFRFDEFRNKTINVSSDNSSSIVEIAKIVQQQYELLFNKKCDLEIKSSLPELPNKFSINRDIISLLNYEFDNREAIKPEINKIFQLLMSN